MRTFDDNGGGGNGGGKVKAAIAAAEAITAPTTEVEIAELVELAPIEFGQRRRELAKQWGVRPADVDAAVEQHRAAAAAKKDRPPHWEVTAASEPVDAGQLIEALCDVVQAHIVMNAHQLLATALWVLLTWVHEEAAQHGPFLMVTSPERGCGKSTLLDLLKYLTKRGLVLVSATKATLFRIIEADRPTMIVDEVDTAFAEIEGLRAIVCSAHARGNLIPRCNESKGNEVDFFNVFAPIAMGLIGKGVPPQVFDRCIVIELARKLDDEVVANFSDEDTPQFQALRARCARWAQDNWAAVKRRREGKGPAMPGKAFVNRVADNWRLIFAIADQAGEDWPDLVRAAAFKVVGSVAEVKGVGAELLADIRVAFERLGIDEVATRDLIEELCRDAERPWATFSRGDSITPKDLAKLLEPYKIKSSTLHPKGGARGRARKGYKRKHFVQAFKRYLPPVDPKDPERERMNGSERQ
jgi:putative DNA primase/helicase